MTQPGNTCAFSQELELEKRKEVAEQLNHVETTPHAKIEQVGKPAGAGSSA
jgi:hypothetical protein